MSDLVRNPLCRFLDPRNQLAIVSGLALWCSCTHGVYKPKSDTGCTGKRCLTGFLDLVWHVRRMSDKKYHFFSPKSRLLKNWIVTFWFFLAVKSPGTDADAKKDRMWNYRLVLKRQTSEHSLKITKNLTSHRFQKANIVPVEGGTCEACRKTRHSSSYDQCKAMRIYGESLSTVTVSCTLVAVWQIRYSSDSMSDIENSSIRE